MTKTKDELIESWWPEGSGHSAYSSGACDGASKMYDHRQKEIDVLTADLALERAMNRSHVVALETSAPFQLGAAEASRWWAERIARITEHTAFSLMAHGMDEINELRALREELNAAAAGVMGK